MGAAVLSGGGNLTCTWCKRAVNKLVHSGRYFNSFKYSNNYYWLGYGDVAFGPNVPQITDFGWVRLTGTMVAFGGVTWHPINGTASPDPDHDVPGLGAWSYDSAAWAAREVESNPYRAKVSFKMIGTLLQDHTYMLADRNNYGAMVGLRMGIKYPWPDPPVIYGYALWANIGEPLKVVAPTLTSGDGWCHTIYTFWTDEVQPNDVIEAEIIGNKLIARINGVACGYGIGEDGLDLGPLPLFPMSECYTGVGIMRWHFMPIMMNDFSAEWEALSVLEGGGTPAVSMHRVYRYGHGNCVQGGGEISLQGVNSWL